MCVMNSDSGFGSVGTLRCCSVEDRRSKPDEKPASGLASEATATTVLSEASVIVVEFPSTVDETDVDVKEVSRVCSRCSSTSGTLERLFIANDRGKVKRS